MERGLDPPSSAATSDSRHGIVGRTRESEAIRARLDDAIAGASGVLVLQGVPGIGKTSLLDFAADIAAGFRIERIEGIECEHDLGFAALQRLLLPFGDGRDRLPRRQHDALQSALGLIDRAQTDRFLVGLAALSLLADSAIDRPLLCLVDDAQWLDRESLDALAFVARRLHAERLVMLFATRDEEVPQFVGLPTLGVVGLGRDDVEALLRFTVDTTLASEIVDRVVAETGGNPLAVTELGAELTGDPHLLASLTPNPLPVSGRIERHYTDQLVTLSDAAQRMLLVAAADPSLRPDSFRRVVATLGGDDEAEAEVVASGLVRLEPRIEFRHPLVRSAVYAAAPPNRRCAVHAALAESLDPVTDRERRGWHLASAVRGPDPAVADELEATARNAAAQGRYAGAAALLSRSAELSVEPDTRGRRQLDAAQAFVVAGGLLRARQLVHEAQQAPTADPVLRAQGQRLRAAIESYTFPSAVPKVRFDAAQALEALDVRMARDTYAEALEACLVAGQFTAGTTPAEIAHAALAAPPAPGGESDSSLLTDLMLEGFATRFALGYEPAAPVLHRAVAQLRDSDLATPTFTRWSVLANNASAELWDAENYIAILEQLEPYERDRGALDALRVTLGGLGHAEMWQGRFDAAEARHDEATEITRALGADAAGWEMLKVELFAWQGREELVRQIAAALLHENPQVPRAGVAVNLGLIALTVLEQAQGHYKEALQAALPLLETDIPPHGSQALAEVVEAGSRSGDLAVAVRALDRLERRAAASGTAWARGLLARSRALLVDDTEAETYYRTSIDELSATPVRTDLARAHLLYGEWLRRVKRLGDAREQLYLAFEIFAEMGASLFADRARIEIAATGERVRRRSVDTTRELTSQEAHVAQLAAQGATNREIATKLFISATTVDYHLRKVFRKLEVTSRRQLRNRLPR